MKKIFTVDFTTNDLTTCLFGLIWPTWIECTYLNNRIFFYLRGHKNVSADSFFVIHNLNHSINKKVWTWVFSSKLLAWSNHSPVTITLKLFIVLDFNDSMMWSRIKGNGKSFLIRVLVDGRDISTEGTANTV